MDFTTFVLYTLYHIPIALGICGLILIIKAIIEQTTTKRLTFIFNRQKM